VVWCGEVEACTGVLLEFFVSMELGAVVGRDGEDRTRFPLNEFGDASIELCGGSGGELADDGESGLTLDQGDDAVGITATHDGIDLPVPEARAVLGAGRAFGDVAFAREYTA